MKKILLILSTELSCYQMLTYVKQQKERCIVDLLIEVDDKNSNKNNRIFKSISRKTFFIKKFHRPIFFNISKFWNIFFAYRNKIIKNKIYNLLKKNSFNLSDYNEVCFSNESISSYVLCGSKIKKIYFDHSPIDVLLKIKLNFITDLNNFFVCLINNKVMNIYYKGNGNFSQKSIFANFLKKKNSTYALQNKIFKNFYLKFNKGKFKKYQNANCNLINFYLPYFAFNSQYSKKISNIYIDFFIKEILSKILSASSKNDIFLFKFRQTIPIKFQIHIINLMKNKFPDKKFVLINKEFPKMINLEKVIANFNIKKYFTSPSSSIFLTKVLNSKISIYDYGSQWSFFLKKNWSLFKNKNNFNNYFLASRFYKNITNKF